MPRADSKTSPERGLVIIYTGEGKGKTTAAMGLALRAIGYGRRVLVIQFVKTWFTGELAGFKLLGPKAEFVQAGKGFYKILGDKLPDGDHKEAAAKALELARSKLESGKYDVVILDEIIGTVVGGLLEPGAVVDLVKAKPKEVDLVLTGRHAEKLKPLMKLADLVTEMVKVKHPYDQGILAKRGIDY